jgi:hypothetical protein
MENYLNNIKYAAENLISLLWVEHENYSKYSKELEQIVKLTNLRYRQAENLMNYGENIDDVAMGIGIHWDTYFGSDKTAYEKKIDLDLLENKIKTTEFSYSSISGSLLQYAKQGISLVHGSLNVCPNGRNIGTLSLKTIIWQGRNQSLHFEEGKFSPQVTTCFNELVKNYGLEFANFHNKNMAFEIIKLLDWKNWDSFYRDLLSLK